MANHYQNIVVAVDGSKQAELAFRKSIDVALRNTDSTLHIIHVIDTSFATSVDMLYDNMVELVREHSQVLLDNYKTQANEAGVKNVNTILTKGVPKIVLSKNLSEEDFDYDDSGVNGEKGKGVGGCKEFCGYP